MRVLPKALSFDGEDDYVQVSEPVGLSPKYITAEVLVRLNDLGHEHQFLYIESSGTSSKRWFYLSSWESTGAQVRDHNGIHAGVLNTDGSWGRSFVVNDILKVQSYHHIVVTVDTVSGELRCYLDCELVVSASRATGDIPGTPINIYVGNAVVELDRKHRGLIALVRIYNRVLSEDEVRWNFYHLDDPVRDGLVLWLHWDSIDAEAGVWRDKSGYGNHGAIYGATPVDVIKKPVRILSPPSRVISPPLR